MLQLLSPWNARSENYTLESLSKAAMRFYRAGGIPPFAYQDYLEQLLIERREWDQVIEVNDLTGSISQLPPERCSRHSEAKRRATEMLGYGAAVHLLSNIFNIGIDRFFFGTEQGARPDFRARLTSADLVNLDFPVSFLKASGEILRLEVKARTLKRPSRSRTLPIDLHEDFVRKMAQWQGRFIGAYVAIPHPDLGDDIHPARIVIADPGEPKILEHDQQLDRILTQMLSMCARMGLWNEAFEIIKWLYEIVDNLHDSEIAFLKTFNDSSDRSSEYLRLSKARINREHLGRTFSGRLSAQSYDSSALGITNAREILKELYFAGQLGHVSFVGMDVAVLEAIRKRDRDTILALGITQEGQNSLFDSSAFVELSEEPSSDLVEQIGMQM